MVEQLSPYDIRLRVDAFRKILEEGKPTDIIRLMDMEEKNEEFDVLMRDEYSRADPELRTRIETIREAIKTINENDVSV